VSPLTVPDVKANARHVRLFLILELFKKKSSLSSQEIFSYSLREHL
jgi:hypothetical protein